MLKNFDRDDLVKLCSLVHERFNSTEATEDKERELWVELKRLFEPDDDTLWKLQRYTHDLLKWKLYDTCVVYHVSTERGHDISMLVEKDYPLTRALMTLMLSNKLQVDEYSHRWFNSEKLVDLNDNHKFKGGLLGIKGFYNFVLLVQLSTVMRRLSTVKLNGQTEVVNHGLKQYLRAMVSDRPQQWVSFLPLAEFSYNTSFHSSIKMTLYQALYGRLPPLVIPYPPGSSKVATIDELLVERDALLRDMVLVKLQPYRKIMLVKRLSNKLAKRYYRPFEVQELVGKVAYRLALLPTSKIHPVFHMSILKPFSRTGYEVVTSLPEENTKDNLQRGSNAGMVVQVSNYLSILPLSGQGDC
ncbi:ty3-gypsy retrotransposon protein [Tanacetum coccineum]